MEGLLTLLNWVFIVVVIVAVMWVALSNNCSQYHPIPTHEELEEVDTELVFDLLYELNIYTNLVIAIPGLMLLFMGFVVEGSILILASIFSIMWHVTGEQVWSVLDWIFAALAAFVMVTTLLRIAQVRGWPEYVAFWIVLPLMALLAWSGFDQTSDSTSYIKGRASHSLWHVLNGVTMIILALELLRCVPAVASDRLRRSAVNRDLRMWKRWGGSRSGSVTFDLFRDLVRAPN